MLANLTGVHLLLVLAAVVLLFGATKLPSAARNLGQSVKILRSELGPDRAKAPAEVVAEPVAAP